MRETTPAISANTNQGAARITTSTIFMNTSLSPFTSDTTGAAVAPGS